MLLLTKSRTEKLFFEDVETGMSMRVMFCSIGAGLPCIRVMVKQM